jgi:hypothetical protein
MKIFGKVRRHQAWLVALGLRQEGGINYEEYLHLLGMLEDIHDHATEGYGM